MPVLVVGSRVRVGFSVNTLYFSPDYDSIKADLEACLYDTGQFEWVEIIVDRKSVFERDYVLVAAVTAADFAATEDYGGLVAQTIDLCAPDLKIAARDPVKVDAIPEMAIGAQGVQQVNNREGQGATRQPGQCDNLPFFDYLSCQSGISSTGIKTSGIVLAVGAVIVLAVFLRR